MASVVKVVQRGGRRKACHLSLPAGSQRAMVSLESQGLKTGGAASVRVTWEKKGYCPVHVSVQHNALICDLHRKDTYKK